MPSGGLYFERVTVSSTAVGIPTRTPEGRVAVAALLTVETAALRYRYDGGLPTAALGHAMAVDSSMRLDTPANLANFRAIRSSGTDAVLSVTLEVL